jgi:uncharacterized protein (TIGR04222 family)
MFGKLNPFDLSGPEFLLLYSICLGIVSAITIAWRLLQRVARTESKARQSKPLNVWELAYLRGRDLVVAQTAVIDLSAAKLIKPDKHKLKLLAVSQKPDRPLSPVPNVIFRAAQSADGLSAATVQKEIAFECDRIRTELVDRGMIKTGGDRFWEASVGYLGFGLLMAAGLMRVGMGLVRESPVGYLMLLLLLTFLVGLALTYTGYLTNAGRQALKESATEMQRQGPQLGISEAAMETSGETVPAMATWAFAVAGLSTAQSMLDPDITELIKKHGMTADGGASDGSGTGCGGGDGGGCGGGGCGGCGS